MATTWRIKFSFSIFAFVLILAGVYGIYECQNYTQKRLLNYAQFTHLNPSAGWYQITGATLDYSSPIPYTNNYFKSGYLVPMRGYNASHDQMARVLVFVTEADVKSHVAESHSSNNQIAGMIDSSNYVVSKPQAAADKARGNSIPDTAAESVIVLVLNRKPNPPLSYFYFGAGVVLLLLAFCNLPQVNLYPGRKQKNKRLLPVETYTPVEKDIIRQPTLATNADSYEALKMLGKNAMPLNDVDAPSSFKEPAPIVSYTDTGKAQQNRYTPPMITFYENSIPVSNTHTIQADEMEDDEIDAFDNITPAPQPTIDDIRTKKPSPNPNLPPPFDPY